MNRRFVPETLVIKPGSKSLDLGNYPHGDTQVVIFTEPLVVCVNCHFHSNMTGTIVVTRPPNCCPTLTVNMPDIKKI